MKETRTSIPSWTVRLYMAGSVRDAAKVVGAFVRRVGWCVNIRQTLFVYSGGQEDGFVVEAIAYARFPSDRATAEARMNELASLLCVECNQRSYTIDDGVTSTFVACSMPFESITPAGVAAIGQSTPERSEA